MNMGISSSVNVEIRKKGGKKNKGPAPII